MLIKQFVHGAMLAGIQNYSLCMQTVFVHFHLTDRRLCSSCN